MDIIYFENLKNCNYFEPIYKRPGIYFKTIIDGIEFEANYEKKENDSVYLLRASKKLTISHWVHAYVVNKYFENDSIKEIIIDSGNKRYRIRKIELLNKESWILKDLSKLKRKIKQTGSHCRFCKIKSECHQQLFDEGDITVIPAIDELFLKRFDEMNIDFFSIIETDQMDKFDRRTKKALYNLKAYKEKRIIPLSPQKLPKDYIVFDVETYSSFDFLFGFLENDVYTPFLIEKNNDSKIHEMINWLYEKNKILVHYDLNDIKSLQNISNKYRELSTKIDKLIKNSIDIYEIINKNYAFPVTSYSLKDISKTFNFEWRTDLNGYAILIEYQRYLKGEKKPLEKILIYNEDDCKATKIILDNLREKKYDKFI
jgi:uncharacterized protein